MVQMHPLSSSPTSVAYEAEGGIRNPACQDADSLEDKAGDLRNNCHQKTTAQLSRDDKDSSKLHGKSPNCTQIMTVCRTGVPWRFSANFLIAVFVLVVLISGELGYIPNSTTSGFYCNDPKISYKFTGETITPLLLLFVGIPVPLILLWATELSCYSAESYKSPGCTGSRGKQIWKWYGYYTVGYLALLFVCEITKIVIGEPRPHFFDSCRPRELVNCTGSAYMAVYTCTNTDLSWIHVADSARSFPSGHSAFSMFTATFIIWYFQKRIPNRAVLLLVKPWLHCMAVIWAITCSMTRITDNRHHWWDVAAGAAMGIGFAIFVVCVFCERFREPFFIPTGNGYIENLENGLPRDYEDKRHRSVRKLLGNAGVDVEGRELNDVPKNVPWNA